jgi:hypothetical protein
MSIETAQGLAVLQLAYQSFEEDVKHDSFPSSDATYVKLTYNVLRLAFLGKAFLFDGEKFVEVGVPEAVIYPVLVTDGDKAYFTCGLKEDGSVVGILYGYNMDGYELKADKDYVAFIISEGIVLIMNENNTAVGTIKLLGTAPLLKGWKLVSRKPFIAIIQSV